MPLSNKCPRDAEVLSQVAYFSQLLFEGMNVILLFFVSKNSLIVFFLIKVMGLPVLL